MCKQTLNSIYRNVLSWTEFKTRPELPVSRVLIRYKRFIIIYRKKGAIDDKYLINMYLGPNYESIMAHVRLWKLHWANYTIIKVFKDLSPPSHFASIDYFMTKMTRLAAPRQRRARWGRSARSGGLCSEKLYVFLNFSSCLYISKPHWPPSKRLFQRWQDGLFQGKSEHAENDQWGAAESETVGDFSHHQGLCDMLNYQGLWI